MEISPIHDPKSFISQVLIEEIGNISISNVYLSFVLISIGIEFLGKCIDDGTSDWSTSGKSEIHFNLAISELMPMYRPYNLYRLLRCGLSHSLAPQDGLALSESKNNTIHLTIKSDGTLVLNIENFYNDFKNACMIVINNIDKNFYKNKKIYQPFLVSKS